MSCGRLAGAVVALIEGPSVTDGELAALGQAGGAVSLSELQRWLRARAISSIGVVTTPTAITADGALHVLVLSGRIGGSDSATEAHFVVVEGRGERAEPVFIDASMTPVQQRGVRMRDWLPLWSGVALRITAIDDGRRPAGWLSGPTVAALALIGLIVGWKGGRQA